MSCICIVPDGPPAARLGSESSRKCCRSLVERFAVFPPTGFSENLCLSSFDAISSLLTIRRYRPQFLSTDELCRWGCGAGYACHGLLMACYCLYSFVRRDTQRNYTQILFLRPIVAGHLEATLLQKLPQHHSCTFAFRPRQFERRGCRACRGNLLQPVPGKCSFANSLYKHAN